MKRRPARKARPSSARKSRNPARPAKRKSPFTPEDLATAKRVLPRGSMLYGILRSHAASDTRTIALVTAKGKTISRVWASIGKAAGLRYSERSDGFIFPGGGYSAMQEAAEALSRAIYGNASAIKYADSYL